MILKFTRSLISDKIELLQKEAIWILEDLEKHYPSIAEIPVFADLALAICFLKIAMLEAILGEGK